ncbi:MAG: lipase maturation factor family protein [Acidobacteria bacterium]|nr:lipase maturation factor family protein [Acidobacteriota bacterium]
MHGSYALSRWLFLRLLGVVYLIAFLSLWVQIHGLVGADGILPVGAFLERVHDALGIGAFRQAPTLLWLGSSDLTLDVLCGLGVALSGALIAGLAPIPTLLGLWAVYLSLSVGGQTFLSFQWDTLLLETGFSALVVAPVGWRPRAPTASPPPSRAGLWLVWLLLVKLMVLSGAVKLLSLDQTWWRLTALDFHFWTQPLPTPLAWYAAQLPAWLKKLSILLTYILEIVLPFFVFAGPRGRRAVAVGTAFLMLMIGWTGNYGFFNLLTLVLCLPLVDDAVWRRLVPSLRASRPSPPPSRPPLPFVGRTRIVLVALWLGVSALVSVRELARTLPTGTGGPLAALQKGVEASLLDWSGPTVLAWIAPFRTINGYGLFRSMTTERPEIVVEGSRDGVHWQPYELPWKPGDPARRPRFVTPHMPRLDWQMWFAALSPRGAEPWLAGLMRGLLEGSPEVLDLFATDPFPGAPPRYVRLFYYRYRFTTPAEHHATGAWWHRELVGPLTGPASLDALSFRRHQP